MKFQHLAIIFIIIILPISMVIASYMQTQIDTISLQTSYNTILQNATYDAIKAFQLNTINNKYSSISDSKIRDIEASINTFYSSLGTGMGASGYDVDTLKQYIPSILYTMYDGYYIYGKYLNQEKNDYQYGLKPYVYYSCRYKDGNNTDFVVNYTLDNSITIYGKISGEYVTKSGYLIKPSSVTNVEKDSNGNLISLIYDGVKIQREILEEQLINDVNDETKGISTYQYVMYNNKKVYKEINSNQYFWYNLGEKTYITDEETLNYVRQRTENGNLYSDSALQYYNNANELSIWIKNNIGKITQNNAVDFNGNSITDFATNTGNAKIFDLNDDNNPLISGSVFNENRISVIRRTIQTNLAAAIANYSSSAGTYEFAMPIFTEEDWDKLENNISVATFMQGIPIGSKYFNNYSIITNNKNEELITKESLYAVTTDGESHLVNCKDLIDKKKEVKQIYKNIDFERQTVISNSGTEKHYYPHSEPKCYKCIVNVAKTYFVDDIINGQIKEYNNSTDTYVNKDVDITNLREKYLTALARERYDLYRTNSYFR